MQNKPIPPKPFASWLEYAVEVMPTRELFLDILADEESTQTIASIERGDFRKAAREELAALTIKANSSTAVELYSTMKAIHDFWTDCAENVGKGGANGACLSPSAMITDDDRTIAQAVAEVIAKIKN